LSLSVLADHYNHTMRMRFPIKETEK